MVKQVPEEHLKAVRFCPPAQKQKPSPLAGKVFVFFEQILLQPKNSKKIFEQR